MLIDIIYDNIIDNILDNIVYMIIQDISLKQTVAAQEFLQEVYSFVVTILFTDIDMIFSQDKCSNLVIYFRNNISITFQSVRKNMIHTYIQYDFIINIYLL